MRGRITSPKAVWALPAGLLGLSLCLLPMVSGRAGSPSQSSPGPLIVKDYLGHAWTDELVHFDLKWTGGPTDISLNDSAGRPTAFQLTNVERDREKRLLSAQLWTVVSLKPGEAQQFLVLPRKADAAPAPEVSVARTGSDLVLRNGKIGIRIPQLPGKLTAPDPLTGLPAPLLAVQRSKGDRTGNGTWFGGGEWTNNGPGLDVREATTTVLSPGPLLAEVRQQYLFADGSSYSMDLRLGARQDAAQISEQSTVARSNAAFRFSLRPGLNADSVYWQNQSVATDAARAHQRVTTRAAFGKENVVCKLRPWSFWWLNGISQWAGFYQTGSDDFVGVTLLHPSRWSPAGWAGFNRTEIPVTAGPNQRLDLTLVLAPQSTTGQPITPPAPLHREWALTAGSVADNVPTNEKELPGLRRQLIRYSEFPLDEVKEYGFDFAAEKRPASQRFLLFGDADLQRVRQQAQEVESVRTVVNEAKKYIAACGGVERTLAQGGAQAFYTRHYLGNYLVEKLPTAYLGSADPLYGKLLAASVKGLTQQVRDDLLENPARSSIGALGPWFSENATRLLFAYELVAGTPYLDAEADTAARNMLVFSAHLLSHPDYWNTERGLSSANPNMTSSILLPRGLLGLALHGHPDADTWLSGAEEELKRELVDWVSPSGAWVESPGYQAASLDGMFLLAQALRNVTGRDYFADPLFRATMEYYGFLLTPPDPRFPPKGNKATATLPSIGDTFSGHVTGFNGWMAAATARTDPEYSQRQQFFWKAQGSTLGNAARAKGLMLGVTDPSLPAAQPKDLSREFLNFGSVLRTSWTDPKATYIAHRTGPSLHHYHDDYNSLVLYAKGAPLCTDFGNLYQPVQRSEAWYHNRVSWEAGEAPKHFGSTGQLVEFRTLPASADYSMGRSTGSGGQSDVRSILLVKSPDPGGDSYAIVRDQTSGSVNQPFVWNLWCLANDLQIDGRSVAAARGDAGGGTPLPDLRTGNGSDPYTFTGQLGVDLDVHVLSPSNARAETGRWGWKQQIYVWGAFEEEQQLLRLRKQGPADDFLTVLYPRSTGAPAAAVSQVAEGAGARVRHGDGSDLVLLCPGKPTTIRDNAIALEGEVGFVRTTRDAMQLVLIKGASASARGWTVRSNGSVALAVETTSAHGEVSGEAQEVRITPPQEIARQSPKLTVDGKPVGLRMSGGTFTLTPGAGSHTFRLTW